VDDPLDPIRERRGADDRMVAHRRVPARDPAYADVDLEGRLSSALSSRGIDRLYRHQAAAVRAVRDGDDVVVATPTASGKSLAYAVPAVERAMAEGARTLYLAPQNALIADQTEWLDGLARDLGFGSRVSVASYTGRLSRTEKESVRDRRPTVLTTNPDMLHYGLLPHARRLWSWLFGSLETVVIDEMHRYRGVFGSHVALLLRRLARLCDRFGSDPQFVCCSATIGNPVEHAARLTGRPTEGFALVDDDASGRGPRDWVLWNPPERAGGTGRRRSSHVETERLFVDLVERGVQTLAFTRARQTAERYATESADRLRERGARERASGVVAYQAALGDDRRREIETGLHDGSVAGVWSTSALELGVDVGGLDAVLLDGYPGTRMATFQRAGRAGRGTDPALVVLVGGEDQLDQYVLSNPGTLFDGDAERATLDPENEHLLPDHLASAAAENWLSPADADRFGDPFDDAVATLEAEGRIERRDTDDGVRWTHAGDGSPQQATPLRRAGDRQVDLLADGDVVATLALGDAFRDAHPGAVYHHQGQSYEVVELDLDRDVARLSPTWADYYTRVRTEKSITVDADRASTPLSGHPEAAVHLADVTVTERVTGYERRDAERGETLGTEPVDLPPTTLSTTALYFAVPPDVETSMREVGDLPGGIHAAEHGLISLLPLELLCDRADVGGLSTPHHDHTGRSTVFVYDGHPGGVGIVRGAYGRIGRLLDRTGTMIADCDCADGCPACVQSPHCGNANEPLTKAPAVCLLDAIADPE
jgi:DEAD/DEAH box helicase domain-containing protein